MIEKIVRDVYLFSKRRVAPIYIVQESLLPIALRFADYTIPEGAAAQVYCSQFGNDTTYTQAASIADNSVEFTPVDGFFRPGNNKLWVTVNGEKIPSGIDVCCELFPGGEDSSEPEAVKPYAIRAEKAAKRSEDAAAMAAEVKDSIQEDYTALSNVVNHLKGDKLDKTPGTWPVWDAEQQETARENLSAASAAEVGVLRDEVIGYERPVAARYYRLEFDRVMKTTTGALSLSASASEIRFYTADGAECAVEEVRADSEFSRTHAASNVLDGNTGTFWSSKDAAGVVHTLEFTLAEAVIATKIGIVLRKDIQNGLLDALTVKASADGAVWEEVLHFENEKDGWASLQWRYFDLAPFIDRQSSIRGDLNQMANNYTRVLGTELALAEAAKSRIKRLVVTPNKSMANDATPDNILSHGVQAGVTVTDAQGQVTAFEPDMRLICMNAPQSYLTDGTIDGVACAMDVCDWSARKLRRRFASYAFKGRESLKTFGSNTGCFANYRFTLPVTPTLTGNANNVIGLCTHYPYVPYNDIKNQTSGYGISITANSNGTHTLVVFDERFSTVEEFAAYLTEQNDAGTPVTFYYMLNPAVEEEIGAEDFERFEGFLLPGGESTVTNPDGCMLEMDYWKEFPTKNYGDWIYDLLSLKEMRAAAGSGNSGGGISLPNTVTVEEFGAVGDGLTDDTQAFIDALATGKNVLCLGESYVLSDRLNIMVAGQKLTGSGRTSLKFISTDPEKVGVDMRNHYCELSGVSLYGTGVGFGLRLGRNNPDVWDSNTKQQINDVRIYDFDIGITATSKINHSIFTNIVILRCDKAINMPNTNPEGNFIAGVVGVMFNGCLIDHSRMPYLFEASNVYFNGLNIGLTEESRCSTNFGNYVFVNSKYEANNTMVDQVVKIVKSSHVYIAHHFALGSASDSTAAFRADHGNGIVFIGCDMQTNGPSSSEPTVRHFIAPDSTFNTPRAVWFGPGERTNATRIPRPILDDYPENRKYYVDFYNETSVPAFDAEADEGKVLKIVGGVVQWVTP